MTKKHDTPDYYDVLQVSPRADGDTIDRIQPPRIEVPLGDLPAEQKTGDGRGRRNPRCDRQAGRRYARRRGRSGITCTLADAAGVSPMLTSTREGGIARRE